MSNNNELSIPKGYKSTLSIRETELAIKVIKDFFEHDLAYRLHLTRVSAPLFVKPSTGLNDNLNGIERPVAFDVKDLDGEVVEVVQSLAKWKRDALKRYGFMVNEGLYTDMNAIRRDEETDNLHSIYVDQWDWEVNIEKSQRTKETLQRTVKEIYQTMKDTEILINQKYPEIIPVLPEDIFFISSQELEDAYPKLNPKQREDAICLKKKAVFLFQIGGK
jgi:aspartate--ammonia ligase